jgi:hypothetical protein
VGTLCTEGPFVSFRWQLAWTRIPMPPELGVPWRGGSPGAGEVADSALVDPGWIAIRRRLSTRVRPFWAYRARSNADKLRRSGPRSWVMASGRENGADSRQFTRP